MVQIQDMWFSYKNMPPYILQKINFDAEKGDYISILGENGSGKSTLIRILLGFLKPSQGTVINNAGRIGYVPQKLNIYHSDFPITVYEMLYSYQKILKLKKDAVSDALAFTGMEAFRNHLISDLSGGQMQKIAISRALMGNPDLLILDEPSTGIDSESRAEIYRLLKSMNSSHQITVIAVEHNLEAAYQNSNRIYRLKDGFGCFESLN